MSTDPAAGDGRSPVTIITGFLGSGKTTLLNHILRAPHGHRIAVIENELGEVGIDNEILLQDRDEQIVEMNNGCICCTVRGDLVRILGTLAAKRQRGEARFERVIIETTGMADPGPVAQTFFVEEAVVREYRLDGIVTLVDAKHGARALDAHREAQQQVGFADRILLSKTDLVTHEQVQTLSQRLHRMNARAAVKAVRHGHADIADVLDLGGFELDAALAINGGVLGDLAHHHDDEIGSFVCRETAPFDIHKLESLLGLLIERYGDDMLRYKGVLHVAGHGERIIVQGVHKLAGTEPGRVWGAGERRESVMVFIGRKLPRALFAQSLALCVQGSVGDPAEVLRDRAS